MAILDGSGPKLTILVLVIQDGSFSARSRNSRRVLWLAPLDESLIMDMEYTTIVGNAYLIIWVSHHTQLCSPKAAMFDILIHQMSVSVDSKLVVKGNTLCRLSQVQDCPLGVLPPIKHYFF